MSRKNIKLELRTSYTMTEAHIILWDFGKPSYSKVVFLVDEYRCTLMSSYVRKKASRMAMTEYLWRQEEVNASFGTSDWHLIKIQYIPTYTANVITTTYDIITYNLVHFLLVVDSIILWECHYLSLTFLQSWLLQSWRSLLHLSCWLGSGTSVFTGILKPRALGCELFIILSVLNPRLFCEF